MSFKVGDRVKVLNAKRIEFGEHTLADGDVTTVIHLNKYDNSIYIKATRGKKANRNLLIFEHELGFIKKLEGNNNE